MQPSNQSYVEAFIAPFGPRLPLDELVEKLNNLYHAIEATRYDFRHPEIFSQLPPIWSKMVSKLPEQTVQPEWRIIDFGCGTGFASLQAIKLLPKSSIKQLICYDPSSEMLGQCRAKIFPLYEGAVFTSSLDDLSVLGSNSNLLITNSLLHHLPNPLKTISGIMPFLSKDAYWLCGHEPSRRFYNNSDLISFLNAFIAERSWTRYLTPANYIARLRNILGLTRRLNEEAADKALKAGLFSSCPPAKAIDLLVDFHVIHSPNEAWCDRGFDYETMSEDLASTWELNWVTSYSYFGNYPDSDIPMRWRRRSTELAAKYPNDGANFCAVWHRTT